MFGDQNFAYDIMDTESLVELLQRKPLPRSHSFRSVWRVLHVDGFEKSKNTIQFYHYDIEAEPLCGRCGQPRSEKCGNDYIPLTVSQE